MSFSVTENAGPGRNVLLAYENPFCPFSLAPSEQLLRGDQENPATFFYTERHLLAEKHGPARSCGTARAALRLAKPFNRLKFAVHHETRTTRNASSLKPTRRGPEVVCACPGPAVRRDRRENILDNTYDDC